MIAIRRLIDLKRNQAIVISGESGAGKTETAKNAMKCVTYFFGKNSPVPVDKNQPSLEDQILGCNPILEAFGNSKTVRNDNSSRFGKYTTINLDVITGKIEGAKIQTYLLEKSRVCEPSEGERNYHVFYHLLKGGGPDLLKKCYLVNDPKQYKYLAPTGCFDVPTVNDEKCFQECEDAFKVTGFNDDERLTIWKVVACCLLLGNVSFKDAGNDKAVVEDKGGVFGKCCDLIGVNPDMLEIALTHNVKIIQGNVIKSPLKVNDCISFRNAFAKELYNK
jgi:myosin heavy subunit